MSININIPDINEQLRNKKSIISVEKKKVKTSSGKIIEEKSFKIVPPLNTQINLSVIPRQKILSKASVDQIEIPNSWSWKNQPGICKAEKQGLCGSCWAFATSQVLSDIFYIQDKVRINPDLSTMYLLTCFPGCIEPPCEEISKKYPMSYICGGGNPADLVRWISEYGTTTDHCVNYDACLKNKLCNGNSEDHFGASSSDINKTFPTCGCYVGNDNHSKFFIDESSIKNISVDPDKKSTQKIIFEAQLNQKILKEHIFNIGPAIGCFHVLENFMGENDLSPVQSFTSYKNEEGVYLDMVNYKKAEIIPSSQQSPGIKPKWSGGHAVAIVGWGTAKVDSSLIDPKILEIMKQPKQGLVDVPYWDCRNSWGPNWNNDGFFKMAMYPYNQISQFDVSVIVNEIPTGGSIAFKAGNIKKYTDIRQNNQKFMDKNKYTYFEKGFIDRPPSFFRDNFKTILFIFFILLVIFGGLYYKYKLKHLKNKRKKK
jgi:C1A family cysteine protease